MEQLDQDAGARMHDWARDLWPICRSITGPGIRQTLDWLETRLPGLQRHRFATGEKVFDWTVPQEWTIRDAWIEHESGQRFAEFNRNTLHVMGYSGPIDAELDRADLLSLIYTQADQPDVIPYVTSYYTPRVGFCMADAQKQTLPKGRYRAVIDSTLADGELVLGDLLIPGDSPQEVLFSTYICHPSMANNELSGPVLATALAEYIRALPRRRMSYRFLFLAETIGAVAYLSRHLDHLKAHVQAGFVLSCVGDERAFSHVESRYGTTLADKALAAALHGRDSAKRYSFLERGSDERQFCAPGVDLPVAGFCRSKYGTYPEYHTSADDLTLVTPTGLGESHAAMRSIVDAFELPPAPHVTVLAEPQLGKRGLYPTLSQKQAIHPARFRMNVIAYCDGTNSVFDICARIGANLSDVVAELRVLHAHGLIA
ncbi:DUF4910 domain-containing protein [Roseibaca sp. V10]|uniref:DUF4910 domain-containing protein n=1 Tax=Roseinatronobacter domitianus TaxID=2940293 RepID=A0ABT0M6Q1_9RHOB|nr:DUF4910 domain-containing protein [Roseibaca domitiana]MCL1630055.1 DUF4910 domain-containing protein [Roseibaca domitiana]